MKKEIIDTIDKMGKKYDDLWFFNHNDLKNTITNGEIIKKSEIDYYNIGVDINGIQYLLNILGNINDTSLDSIYKLLEDIYFNGLTEITALLNKNEAKLDEKKETNTEYYKEVNKIISILHTVIDNSVSLNIIYSRIFSGYYSKNYEYSEVMSEYLSVSYMAMKNEMPLVYERSIPFGDDYTGIAENINKEIEILNQQDCLLNIYSPEGKCLIENRVVHIFINFLASALISYQIKDNISYLSKHKRNTGCVFDNSMSLIDDPLLKYGLIKHCYDSECVPCKKKILISNGKINDYLSDKSDAQTLNCTGGNVFSSPPEFIKNIAPTNLVLNISKTADKNEEIDFIFDYLDMSFHYNVLTGDMNGIIWGRKLSGKNKGYCRININDNIIKFFNNIQSNGEMRYYSGYYFPLLIKTF